MIFVFQFTDLKTPEMRGIPLHQIAFGCLWGAVASHLWHYFRAGEAVEPTPLSGVCCNCSRCENSENRQTWHKNV